MGNTSEGVKSNSAKGATIMEATMRTRWQASQDRWQAALRRAIVEGVQVRQLAGSGAWVATSGTDASTAYVVSLRECECPAGEHGDPVCKHRAALAHRLGRLDADPEPEPQAPVAPVRRGSGRMNLTDAELVILRGQAARLHAERGWPLVDVETGEVIAA
ncbi:MAG: SWIM zinc finger family protein [Chloroflexota bacterium]|nr:SWIM zinc finger family protein [Chloroflexota bacterium]